MRFYIFIVGLFLLVTLTIAAKQEQNDEYLEHNVEKYEKASHHHHHHHKKHKTNPELSIEGKKHKKHNQEAKEKKHVPKNAPVEVSPIEAEVQADIKTGHKQLVAEETKRHQEGMHLQDLTYPEQPEAVSHKDEKKRSHQREKHHHKSHSADRKVLSGEKSLEPQEEKLFVEHNTKERAVKSHPVLEDTFETLSDEKVHKDSKSKKHQKKQKPKKAHEKSKKDKQHYKNKSKKDKMKDKKNKKASW